MKPQGEGVLASREGEAPAEPHSLARADKRLRFGRSLTLPWRRNILHGVAPYPLIMHGPTEQHIRPLQHIARTHHSNVP